MASKAWQQLERKVADWFGTRRNPLSGRNNVCDDLSPRLGDIIYSHAVVEVKRRATVSFDVAKDTRELAKRHFKPWIVFEFRTGEPNLVKISCDHGLAAHLAKAADEYFLSLRRDA